MENHPDQSELADAIGSIYESTINPAHWTLALQGMSALVDAFFSSIVVLDHPACRSRFTRGGEAMPLGLTCWTGSTRA